MRVLFAILIILAIGVQGISQPISNPYRDLFTVNGCHWTDSLKWANVYNINNYPATDTFYDTRLDQAQTAASNAGGGIVYFPAGNYFFKNEVTLKPNVILRGDAPLVNNALDSAFAPPSRLIFPEYQPSFTGSGTPWTSAFKSIRCEGPGNNQGLVNLDVNRAFIRLQPLWYDTTFANGYVSKWPTTPKENLIVLGVRNNNAAFPAVFWVPLSAQNQWQRWSWYGLSNIDLHATRNAIVANCRLNDYTKNSTYPIADNSYDQPNYKVFESSSSTNVITIAEGWKTKFDYNAHYGITVNRLKNRLDLNSGTLFQNVPGYWPNGNIKISPPNEEPTLYATGIEIRNNYVYNNQRVAIFVAGQGLIVDNNVLRDQIGKSMWVSRSGQTKTSYNQFLENRGIDMTGWNVTITNNDVHVESHRFETTQYYSNDGEGIMHQECCGGTPVRDYIIKNNKLSGRNAYIGLYKSKDIHNVDISNNDLGGKNLLVQANTNSSTYVLDNVKIDSNFNIGSITTNGSKGGTRVTITNNTGTGNLTWPCHAVLSNNSGFNQQNCTAVPNRPYAQVGLKPTNDSVLFGNMLPIQLTASNATDSVVSLQLWANSRVVSTISTPDSVFNINTNSYSGKVIFSVKATDGANYSAWSNPVTYNFCPDTITSVSFKSITEEPIVYPNPFAESLNISQASTECNYQLIDLSGRVVLSGIIVGDNQQINTSDIPSGLYILRVISTINNLKVSHTKVIKQAY